MSSKTTVAIAGLGLIGGSLAMKLVHSGVKVIAWNHRANPYESARKHGIECVDTVRELAQRKPDVLFLCVPLKAMDSVLAELEGCVDERTTLSDVGSVKREVLDQVTQHGLRSYFVGAHPMTGNEFAGFEAADEQLFRDAVWAITVENDTDFERFLAVARVITDDISNRFVVSDAKTHDEAAAQISHMPHVVATALTNQLVSNSHANLAIALSAGSWRDMTRVSMTTPERTQAMVDENPDNVAMLLRDMAKRLNDVAQYIENADHAQLSEFFHAANPYRDIRSTLSKENASEYTSYDIDLASVGNEWGELLSAVCARGGRVEKIDSARAVIREFPALQS